MDQMVHKYTNILHCKTLQNLPKMGFFVSKCHLATPIRLKMEDKETCGQTFFIGPVFRNLLLVTIL
jgi:hypothetical protein